MTERPTSAPRLRLYARTTSSNCQKVLWFLGELGAEYELVPTGGDAGGLDDPAYRAMNPNARVPTLVDGGFVVWESHAILRYLATTQAGGAFWPESAAERSEIDRWMDWSQSQFDVSFMNLFWGYWRTPEAERDESTNRRLVGMCDYYLKVLDVGLENRPFLAGPQLSLADVPVGALMYRYANLGVTRGLPPNVSAWYQRLTERPGFREAVMLPFEDLKGRLAP
jgi:glutathione S-transferase